MSEPVTPAGGNHLRVTRGAQVCIPACLIQSPSSLLLYISQNHHFLTLSCIKHGAAVGTVPSPPPIPPMLMKLLLIHKSNPFFCPLRRLSLPGGAQPSPFLIPCSTLTCLPNFSHNPSFNPLSHSHHNQITPPSQYTPPPILLPPPPASNHHNLSHINTSPHSI